IMRRLADRIYTFHQAAETTPGIDGSEAMRAVIEGNASELRAARSLNAQKVEALIAHSHKALRDMASLLDRRGASGAIRDCHGDLHLRNICLLDGEPTLFDGVEFNAEITSIDVLYDFAFLLMDLAHRGHIDLANVVFNRYLAMSGEAAYDGLAALGLFQSCRAAIRAHTTVAAAAAQPDASKTIALRAEAAAYLDLALQFLALDTPEMIAVGGLSGTGKSTVAAGLAPIRGNAPGAVILRSDVIRKRMYGAAPKDALSKEAYTRDATARVYERLAMIAATVLEQGQSVIVDAVYAVPAERDAIEAVARRVGAPFRGLWLSAPQSVLQARVAGRDGDASDA
ncbi:MAG: AAA family ATPase, partial [Alphaproteobacteria bacterium]